MSLMLETVYKDERISDSHSNAYRPKAIQMRKMFVCFYNLKGLKNAFENSHRYDYLEPYLEYCCRDENYFNAMKCSEVYIVMN